MGMCTTAIFFYGVVIAEPGALQRLFTVLCRKETPNKDVPEDLDLSRRELDKLESAIHLWLSKSDLPFVAHMNQEERDEPEPVVILHYCEDYGNTTRGGYKIERWGRANYGQEFQAIPSVWTDEKFLQEAQEDFKKLEMDPVMKEANITPSPQWILGLGVDG